MFYSRFIDRATSAYLLSVSNLGTHLSIQSLVWPVSGTLRCIERMTKSAYAPPFAGEFHIGTASTLKVPKFQAKVAGVGGLPNHSIVELLSPLARCVIHLNNSTLHFDLSSRSDPRQAWGN
jgi:hypothetical protein